MIHRYSLPLLLSVGLLVAGCGDRAPRATADAAALAMNQLPRTDFNRRAAELYLPLFWRSDANGNQALDPDELVALWGIGGGGRLSDYLDSSVPGGRFTPQFLDAYRQMARPADLAALAPAERTRRQMVLEELAQGRQTLVETNLRAGAAEDKALVENILAAAQIVERIYARQRGVLDLQGRVAAGDSASQMLMFRNQGPFCEAPKTERNADCSALAPRPRKISGLYPAGLQNGTDTSFCLALEKRADATQLLSPFSVVVERSDGKLEAVPYNIAYQVDMQAVAARLKAAADAIKDPAEAALQRYLAAAAASFLSNDWQPADEAWAKMNATNSKWYLRIGPDEVYDEPCSRKAQFHVSFARINADGLEWQKKLEPRKAQMEDALAKLAGRPYKARSVTFHLPDFIDIVLNAGDSRNALGATIGQSLPNWGPVANEGRGRTVAMVNLYTDADSEASWKQTVASQFCRATMDKTSFDPKLSVMSTVLHEASHNLGPAHEYRINGKRDVDLFGGPLASMLEELKAQTSALYFTDWLVSEGVIDQATAERAHLGDVSWAFGHIAQGMYDAEGKPKTYSQLAAIQMGTFFRQGVLLWRADETAANGTDKGCFDVDLGRAQQTIAQLETRVLKIKASGDKAGAEALKAQFVDGKDDWAQMRELIRERQLRAPKASFVYAIER